MVSSRLLGERFPEGGGDSASGSCGCQDARLCSFPGPGFCLVRRTDLYTVIQAADCLYHQSLRQAFLILSKGLNFGHLRDKIPYLFRSFLCYYPARIRGGVPERILKTEVTHAHEDSLRESGPGRIFFEFDFGEQFLGCKGERKDFAFV